MLKRTYILAGGKATRIGRNKSLLEIHGEAILQRQLRVLKPLCETIVIVADKKSLYQSFGCRVIPDIYKNQGPLGGLHAALTDLGEGQCLVLATDMPFLSARLIRFLEAYAPEADAVVPVSKGKLEPLHAMYSTRCLAAISLILSKGGRKILDFFPHVKTAYLEEQTWTAVEPDARCFMNINTAEDLRAAEDLLKKGRGIS